MSKDKNSEKQSTEKVQNNSEANRDGTPRASSTQAISDNPGENDNNEASTEAELNALRAEAEKNKNDYLYLRAEFENYRKHVIKERSELQKYAAERVIVDFLNIFDNFERALEIQVTPETFKTFVQGVEMTATEFKNVLQKHGVSEVPTLGKPFNPSFHEALTSEVSSDAPEGSVLRVFKKAYTLNEKLIRPAQVVVAKAPEKS